jgi:hypothetical protein
VVKVYGRVSLAPAGIESPYLVAVKLRKIAVEGWTPSGSTFVVDKAPPITATVTGSASLFLISTMAWFAWPFTSFTPKTSACGNEAVTETARLGGRAVSSDAYLMLLLAQDATRFVPLTHVFLSNGTKNTQREKRKRGEAVESHDDARRFKK